LTTWGGPHWYGALPAWALDQDDADAKEECGVKEPLVIDEIGIQCTEDKDQPVQSSHLKDMACRYVGDLGRLNLALTSFVQRATTANNGASE
jgi:hypothetical protein